MREAPESHQSHETSEGRERPVSKATTAGWNVTEMFKITLNYIQVTVLIASLKVGWAFPVLKVGEITEFLGGLAAESVRSSVVYLSKANQFLHPTVWATITSVSIVPVTAFLLPVAFWTGASRDSQGKFNLRHIAQRSMLSLMALWYITSVPAIKTILSVVLCVHAYSIPDGTQNDLEVIDATKEEKVNYWAVDTKLKCFEGQHLTLVISILLFVFVIYVGLLIVFICILASDRDLPNNPDRWVYRTTGFLYRSYKSGWRRYWEVAIVLRKAIIAFLVFCVHRFDSPAFIIYLATVTILAMGVQIAIKPYREKFLNRIDASALIVSLLTIVLAIALESGGFTREWLGLTLSIICVVLTIATFLVLLCFLLGYCAEYIKLSPSECGRHIDADAGTLTPMTIWLGCKLQSLACYLGFGQSRDQTTMASNV